MRRKDGRYLLKRPKEFQPADTKVSCRGLAQHLGSNRRGFGGDDTGRRGWGRRRDSEADDLVGPEEMSGRDTCTGGADI